MIGRRGKVGVQILTSSLIDKVGLSIRAGGVRLPSVSELVDNFGVERQRWFPGCSDCEPSK
jgi:hypothetical protein